MLVVALGGIGFVVHILLLYNIPMMIGGAAINAAPNSKIAEAFAACLMGGGLGLAAGVIFALPIIIFTRVPADQIGAAWLNYTFIGGALGAGGGLLGALASKKR